jgi:hypothetical protein
MEQVIVLHSFFNEYYVRYPQQHLIPFVLKSVKADFCGISVFTVGL